MRANDRCKSGGLTKKNGNCTNLDPQDGLPVQCVGPWALDKHDYLARYIAATKEVRKKFLVSVPGRSAGGAAFVDLFAGPGRARINSSGELIDGSPVLAASHQEAAFTKVVCCDLDPENADALRKRLAPYDGRAVVIEGDSNERIDEVLRFVPHYGLNLALIDPFSLEQLTFSVLRKLAAVPRMDLIVHFPTMDAKRNHAQGAVEKLGKATGSDHMEGVVRKPSETMRALDELRGNLGQLGYTGTESRSAPIHNSGGAVLYHLVFFSKDAKGDKIWNSITRTTSKGQRSLF